MAILTIPTQRDTPHYTQETVLDGRNYLLTFHFNEHDGCWYVDVDDVDGVAIVTGKRIVADWSLLHRVADSRRPPGEMLVIDTTGAGAPGFRELGDRVILTYLDAAELGRDT